jgi:hypothetical protein
MIVIAVPKIIDFRLEHKSGGFDFLARARRVISMQALGYRVVRSPAPVVRLTSRRYFISPCMEVRCNENTSNL